MATKRPSAANGLNGDNELVHVNSDEIQLLRANGGIGTHNPYDGLLQFYGAGGEGGSSNHGGGQNGGNSGDGGGGQGHDGPGGHGGGSDGGTSDHTSTGGTVSKNAGKPGPSNTTGSKGPGSTSVGDPRGNEGLGATNSPGMGPGTSGIGSHADKSSPTGGSFGGAGANANPTSNGGFPGAAEIDVLGGLAAMFDTSPNTIDPTFNTFSKIAFAATPTLGLGMGLTNALHAAGINSTDTDVSAVGGQNTGHEGKDGTLKDNADMPAPVDTQSDGGHTDTSESSGPGVVAPAISGVDPASDADRRRRGSGISLKNGLAI